MPACSFVVESRASLHYTLHDVRDYAARMMRRRGFSGEAAGSDAGCLLQKSSLGYIACNFAIRAIWCTVFEAFATGLLKAAYRLAFSCKCNSIAEIHVW